MTRNWFWKHVFVAQGALLISAGANAAMMPFTERFGDTPATGLAPWLTATFDAQPDPNTVRLTVMASGMGSLGMADITELYFNFGLDPDDLSFARVPLEEAGNVGTILFQAGEDAYRADGDGFFDIFFDLPTSPDDGRMNAGESIVFDISYTGPISATDFFVLSAPGPGVDNPGPFLAAAHLQSTGPHPYEGSDWVAAVPIPAAIWLFASALGMLGFAARRRRHAVAAA